MTSLESFLFEISPVTRAMAVATLATTLGVVFQVIPIQLIFFDWDLITKHFQLWRLFTGFFFVGPLSLGWLFHMYFLIQYSSRLEKSVVFCPPMADRGSFLYFILLEMLLLDSLALLFSTTYNPSALGISLTAAIVYYWSKVEAFQPVSLWGFVIKAWQLPYALLILNFFMNQPIMQDVVGIIAGHVYFFLRDVAPTEHNYNLLAYTPPILGQLVDWLDLSWLLRPSVAPEPSQGTTAQGFSRGRQGGISTLYDSNFFTSSTTRHHFPGPGYRVRDGAPDTGAK